MSLTSSLQACSLCGIKVPRRFCHRNRAGAYICHPCQARRQGRGWVAVTFIRARMVIPAVGQRIALALASVFTVIAVVAIVILLTVD